MIRNRNKYRQSCDRQSYDEDPENKYSKQIKLKANWQR